MNLSIGIVGLPNVGKSTLFNALLKKTVAEAANYPFATIEPNVGVVKVPDARLPVLAKIVKTNKMVPAVVEFYDIAGLVKGASKGEGLGNKFLAHIREVAVIAHVIRLFGDPDVHSVHGVHHAVNPLRDIQTIETELVLADLTTLFKQKEPKGKFSKEEGIRWDTIVKLKKHLNDGNSARTLPLADNEQEQARNLHLLTSKPIIYVFNVSEEQLSKKEELRNKIGEIMKNTTSPPAGGTPPYKGGELKIKNSPPYQGGVPETEFDSVNGRGGLNTIYLNAKLENEVLTLSEPDQKEYLQQYDLEETGLNRLIKQAYDMLDLISFLTAGELEARAWTIKRGTLAPQAAGTIHTDFEKKFIKADVVPFDVFVNPRGLASPVAASEGGWTMARAHGKVHIVGKDYIVRDGDVVEFKIGQ